MNSPKKHKPLSPEELFEWLDKKSDSKDASLFSNSDFENLDEFEKDAIEGFESYSSPDKAKALMDEINLEISKKVVVKEPAKKNRIVWFSAAASLALIISLSIFLVNKTEEETESNIALNGIAPKESSENLPAKDEEIKTPESPANDAKMQEGKSANAEIVTETSKQMPLEKLAEERLESQIAKVNDAENVSVATGVVSTISQNQVDLAKNGVSANTNIATKADGDVAFDSKAVMSTTKDTETSKKKAKEEDKSVNDEVAAVAADENFTKAESVAMNEKSNKDVVYKERKVAQKAAVTKSADTSPMFLQNTATTTVPGYVTDGVYKVTRYEGGESAIKTYVLDYLKAKSITQTLKGTFKVNGTVSEKGKLLIETITSVNGECKDCETVLKKALNEMPDWKPAMQGNKAVSAKTNFSLSF